MVDAILITAYAVLAIAVVAVLFSVLSSVAKRRAVRVTATGVPVARIATGVVAALVITLAATYFFSTTDTIAVSGREYTDNLWLRLTDMFISSAVVLIVLTIVAISLGRLLRGGKRY